MDKPRNNKEHKVRMILLKMNPLHKSKGYKEKGIAMATVLLVLAMVGVAATFFLLIINKSFKITASSFRYLSAFEAAEGGIDYALVEIENAAEQGEAISSQGISMGQKDVTVQVQPLFRGAIEGSNINFGSGYEGIGGGAAGGGVAIFYLVSSSARGERGEKVELESVYRKVVGILAR